MFYKIQLYIISKKYQIWNNSFSATGNEEAIIPLRILVIQETFVFEAKKNSSFAFK